MIYDIDIEKIEEQLRHMDIICQVLQESKDEQEQILLRFQLERAIHLGAECVIEVGTLLIDGFVMRDPGSYLDIVDILQDEQVVTPELAEELREWIRMREQIVRYYTRVELEACLPYQQKVDVLRAFQKSVRHYLQQHT